MQILKVWLGVPGVQIGTDGRGPMCGYRRCGWGLL